MLDGFVLMYLDGILVYSNSDQKYEEHLCIVLYHINEYKLHAKYKKYYF